MENAKEGRKECNKKPAWFPSTRLVVYLTMCTVGLLNIAVRFALNMTIVCMVIPPQQQDINLTLSVNQTSVTNQSNEGNCNHGTAETIDFGYEGEFKWSRSQVGYVLSGYYYGYLPMQLLSGWLADRFGVRHVVGMGTLVGGILSLLTPVAARLHYGLLIALRLVMGLTMGTIFPSFQSFIGRWVPQDERISFSGVLFSGPPAGQVIAFALSGYLCQFSWTLIFYIFGGVVIIWYAAFMYNVYSSPDQHPRISDNEREYIMKSNKLKGSGSKFRTPWRSLLTSPSVIGACVTYFTVQWLTYIVVVGIPLFMQDVLYFNIKANGLLSSLGPLSTVCLNIPVALLLESVLRNIVKSTCIMRKLCMTVYFLLAVGAVATLSFMQCEHRTPAIAMYCLIYFSYTFCNCGIRLTASDIAPKMAGTVFGLMNFVGQLAGVLAPIAIGNLTPHGSQAEWQRVFFLTAGLVAFGWFVFMFFVGTEEQEWAKGNEEIEITRISQDQDLLEKDRETQYVTAPMTTDEEIHNVTAKDDNVADKLTHVV